MINEMEFLDWNTIFAPFLALFVLIIFITLMILAYYKFRIFLVILIIYLFSIVIGVMSIGINDIPFTPYLQIFFLVFQSIFFIITILELYKY